MTYIFYFLCVAYFVDNNTFNDLITTWNFWLEACLVQLGGTSLLWCLWQPVSEMQEVRILGSILPLKFTILQFYELGNILSGLFFLCHSHWTSWGIVEACMYAAARKSSHIVNICPHPRGEIVQSSNVSKKIYRPFGNVTEIYQFT